MRFKPFAAPKRFTFKDPDTGYVFDAANRPTLLRHIIAYRAQNNLPQIESLNAVLENYWCDDPLNKPNCQEANLKKGFLYYIKGGVKLLKNMVYKNYVSQEEADRRSDICTLCPHNVFPDKKGYIVWANAIAEATVGERKSRNHEVLGQCSVCDCPLKAKVWYKGKLELAYSETVLMKQVGCWQPDLAEVKDS